MSELLIERHQSMIKPIPSSDIFDEDLSLIDPRERAFTNFEKRIRNSFKKYISIAKCNSLNMNSQNNSKISNQNREIFNSILKLLNLVYNISEKVDTKLIFFRKNFDKSNTEKIELLEKQLNAYSNEISKNQGFFNEVNEYQTKLNSEKAGMSNLNKIDINQKNQIKELKDAISKFKQKIKNLGVIKEKLRKENISLQNETISYENKCDNNYKAVEKNNSLDPPLFKNSSICHKYNIQVKNRNPNIRFSTLKSKNKYFSNYSSPTNLMIMNSGSKFTSSNNRNKNRKELTKVNQNNYAIISKIKNKDVKIKADFKVIKSKIQQIKIEKINKKTSQLRNLLNHYELQNIFEEGMYEINKSPFALILNNVRHPLIDKNLRHIISNKRNQTSWNLLREILNDGDLCSLSRNYIFKMNSDSSLS